NSPAWKATPPRSPASPCPRTAATLYPAVWTRRCAGGSCRGEPGAQSRPWRRWAEESRPSAATRGPGPHPLQRDAGSLLAKVGIDPNDHGKAGEADLAGRPSRALVRLMVPQKRSVRRYLLQRPGSATYLAIQWASSSSRKPATYSVNEFAISVTLPALSTDPSHSSGSGSFSWTPKYTP